jgi:cytochrome c-type protein NapC/trimethylamine-N-oxide reductase cytochrome c-type subunit TorC
VYIFEADFEMIGWIRRIIKKHGLIFIAGFAFAIICFVVLNLAMEPVSTSEYCGSKCHEMNTAYQSWELSIHASNLNGIRVACIKCHLPPKDNYFTHLIAKAYAGGKDLYKHHFGGEYQVEKMKTYVLEHMPNERCQECHNELLAKPSNSKARIAHTASLNQPDAPESKCVACHEDVGHERQKKLFSP